MDKRTATITLTEKLRSNNGFQIVSNPVYQERLIKNSIACYQLGESKRLSHDNIPKSTTNKADSRNVEERANYLFFDNVWPQRYDTYIMAASFAILGEKEANDLRERFYKDVPPGILHAMDFFGMENYVELYELYSKGFTSQQALADYKFYSQLVNSLSELYEHFPYARIRNFEHYFGMKIDAFHKKLKGMKCPEKKVTEYDSKVVSQEKIRNIIKYFKRDHLLGKYADLLPSFLDFAFTLPYEDRNIEVDKELLKLFSRELDYVDILVKEYSQGEYFQEYFSCLDAGMQEKVVHALKSAPHNPAHDPFLWKTGFREVDLDYLDLYKENAEGFIEYFSSKNPEERKIILKDIMDCDFVNGDVADWLNKNELELVKEVGLNG